MKPLPLFFLRNGKEKTKNQFVVNVNLLLIIVREKKKVVQCSKFPKKNDFSHNIDPLNLNRQENYLCILFCLLVLQIFESIAHRLLSIKYAC